MQHETQTGRDFAFRALTVLTPVWTAAVFGFALLLALQIRSGLNIDTNILDLLPPLAEHAVVRRALDRFAQNASSEIVILAGTPGTEPVPGLAGEIAGKLRKSELFSEVKWSMTEEQRKLSFVLAPYSYQLLSPRTRAELESPGGAERLLQSAREMLYSPMAAAFKDQLASDPLLLLPRYLSELPGPPPGTAVRDDILTVSGDGFTYGILTATAAKHPFEAEYQERALSLIENTIAEAKKNRPQSSILYSGVIRFAAAAAQQMKQELNLIGYGSALGIFLLLTISFRSLLPFAAGLLPLVIGLLIAFSATHLIFGRIHLLTLAFGASLTGVCDDYSVHYLVERFYGKEQQPRDTVRRILPALMFALFTSVASYLALGLSEFPGLRQMAVFSGIGLFAAFVTVLAWFPCLAKVKRRSALPPVSAFSTALIRFWERAGDRRFIRPGLVLLGAVIAAGVTQFEANDDIRLLQKPPAGLLANEAAMHKLLPKVEKTKAFVLTGSTAEEVLRESGKLAADLNRLVASGRLGGYQTLTQFVPAESQQRYDAGLLKRTFTSAAGRQALSAYLEEIGFPEPGGIFAKIEDSPHGILRPENAGVLNRFWLGPAEPAAIVYLIAPAANEDLMQLTSPGVHFIDQVSYISKLLRGYRTEAALLVAAAYICVLLVLCFHYGWVRGLAILAPPLAGGFAALVTLTLFGEALTLFHVISLILVLGLGVDYTIFFAEGRSAKTETALSVLLCAATTLLSFGLLSVSSTPVLASFGKTTGLGIIFSLLLSPFVLLAGGSRK